MLRRHLISFRESKELSNSGIGGGQRNAFYSDDPSSYPEVE